MGYSTYFDGSLKIEPPMEAEHRDFVNRTARSTKYPDLPDCPQAYLQWVISEDGTRLEWDGSEKFYEYEEWLDYLLAECFTPWGYKLNGEIHWNGEEPGDEGIIYVKDNVAEAVESESINEGPSWAKESPATTLTPRELATVLAALRCFQQEVSPLPLATIKDSWEHFDECDPLTTDEIDALCERLNVPAKVDDDLPLACECDNTHQANDTVCRWCWAHGRRHWNDAEIAK